MIRLLLDNFNSKISSVKINIYTENVPQHNLYIILYADLYKIE